MRAMIVAVVSLGLLAGCANRAPAVRVAAFSALTGQQGLSAEDVARIAEHCPFGAPAVRRPEIFGPIIVISHAGYVLAHDGQSKIAAWVCESLEPEHAVQNAERRDPFAPDPKLDGQPRAEKRDYKGSGYDRGHMTPSEDRIFDQARNDETFFLSNMVPQNGSMNSGIWRVLEDRVRGWVVEGKLAQTRIVSAGFFYDPEEEDPDTADGLVEHFIIGDGAVAVPTHLFKLVVGVDAAGERQAIAFALKNEKRPQPYDLRDFVVSVRWLEQRTGLNFLPDLDAAAQLALEAEPSAFWP